MAPGRCRLDETAGPAAQRAQALLRRGSADRRPARRHARLGPHAGGVDRRDEQHVRAAGARPQPVRRRDAGPRRGAAGPRGLPRTGARRRATARIPACSSSSWTPASGSPPTSIPAARSRARRSTPGTARPRPGSSSRPTPAPPSGPASSARWSSTRCATGCARRTRRRCSRRCTSSRSRPATSCSCPPGPRTRSATGILLLELQEPTDFSVLLEWEGFQLSPHDGHLKLGWDRALEALDRDAVRPAAARRRPCRAMPTRTSAPSASPATPPSMPVSRFSWCSAETGRWAICRCARAWPC